MRAPWFQKEEDSPAGGTVAPARAGGAPAGTAGLHAGHGGRRCPHHADVPWRRPAARSGPAGNTGQRTSAGGARTSRAALRFRGRRLGGAAACRGCRSRHAAGCRRRATLNARLHHRPAGSLPRPFRPRTSDRLHSSLEARRPTDPGRLPRRPASCVCGPACPGGRTAAPPCRGRHRRSHESISES